ncbi:MAG: thiamine pyrophosphate-binding protein [Dehalococcoidia bacterium]
MPELNGGQLVAHQLKLAGIDTAFGVVAGPMIEVMAGMEEAGIRVVNCRHELSACFMASAWGYINRKPGVVVAGSGPAVTNCVTGLHVATESGMPLVVLGGSVHARTRGLGGFQEADQLAFTRPAAKWTAAIDSTERIPEYVHLALGKALAGRPGGAYVDFPGNLVSGPVDPERAAFRREPLLQTPPHPDPAGIEAISRMLSTARRPLVLVGKGAAWADATIPLTRLAERGIPFVASPMGRGVIPDGHPLAANAARSAALEGADVILLAGGRFNWIFQFGRPPRFAEGVRLAQIDLIAEEFASAADLEVGVVADVGAGVRALDEALGNRSFEEQTAEWRAHLNEAKAKNQAAIAEQLSSDAKPINHYRLVRELRDAITPETAVAVDAELTMAVARAALPGYQPRLWLNSGTTGCMGTGVPYAIGAKLARPEQPSVALVGDYAFGAACAEVETAARVGAPVVFVVSNNGGIAGHSIQDRFFRPESPPVAALLQAGYEKLAEMVGGYGRRVTAPDEIGPAIREALAADTVAVVNVITDPKGGRRGTGYLG